MKENESGSKTFKTGHIGLNVNNIERAKAFYEGIFNLKIMKEGQEQGRQFVFLGDGSAKPMLTLWQQSSKPFEHDKAGLHHLSFEVPSMDAVRTFEKRLKNHAVPFIYEGIVPHAEGPASGGIFFEDPDGIRLEIYATSGAEGACAPTAGTPSCGFF